VLAVCYLHQKDRPLLSSCHSYCSPGVNSVLTCGMMRCLQCLAAMIRARFGTNDAVVLGLSGQCSGGSSSAGFGRQPPVVICGTDVTRLELGRWNLQYHYAGIGTDLLSRVSSAASVSIEISGIGSILHSRVLVWILEDRDSTVPDVVQQYIDLARIYNDKREFFANVVYGASHLNSRSAIQYCCLRRLAALPEVLGN
jgi:hypothetical protein